MQLRIAVSLCSCFFIASCSGVTLEGKWQCNEIVVERDQFTAYGDSSVQYLDDGTFLEEFNITYDFVGIGKVTATVLQPGSWRLDSDILIKKSGQGSMVDFHTVTNIPEDIVRDQLRQLYSPDEVLRSQVSFVNDDRIELLELGDDAGGKNSCVRQPQ
jgi:hypothetical protein